ncbi:MAG: ATP-binding protein [Bacteroidetes bacterium CHB5]|nr:ATP-binding protein [Bacteroidetes bacterium CHB5]
MDYQRILTKLIQKALVPGKAVVLLGARRTGKTYLVNQLIESVGKSKCLLLNGEDMLVQQQLSQRSVTNYKQLVAGYKYLIIDEAQKLPEAGLILKLMVDELKELRILATGSSMFDLNNKLGEPLTGRKTEFRLFPLAQIEYAQYEDALTRQRLLDEKLIFGCYPEVSNLRTTKQKQDYLRELTSAYLYKDILALENLRNADKIFNLLKLVAWQVGHEVSLEELGRNLQMSKNTVERYLDLLTKVFILFKLEGYSRNLRKEIVKTKRWYFHDNGIRNAIVANFAAFTQREDTGLLWENYLASERLKVQHYQRIHANNYFWRTHDRQEIDWVEERTGKLFGYEFKLTNNKVKAPKAWREAYPDAKFTVVNKENFEQFVFKK